jgi:hypothetical protein
MQVFKCELCKDISEDYFHYGEYKQYCNPCNDILRTIRQEELMKLRDQFKENYGQVIGNQVQVVRLCQYIVDNEDEYWAEYFGVTAMEHIYGALEK